jgi:hypothetical protein
MLGRSKRQPHCWWANSQARQVRRFLALKAAVLLDENICEAAYAVTAIAKEAINKGGFPFPSSRD